MHNREMAGKVCVAVLFFLGSILLLAAEGVSVQHPSSDAVHGLSITGMALFVFGSLGWLYEEMQ